MFPGSQPINYKFLMKKKSNSLTYSSFNSYKHSIIPSNLSTYYINESLFYIKIIFSFILNKFRNKRYSQLITEMNLKEIQEYF